MSSWSGDPDESHYRRSRRNNSFDSDNEAYISVDEPTQNERPWRHGRSERSEQNGTQWSEDCRFRTMIAETAEAEQYVKLIMDLQPYVEKLNIPVPMIVVFGDQSA